MHPSRRAVAINAFLLLLISAPLCPLTASAQDESSFEPYQVYVLDEDVFARCGPSPDYYRTEPLRPGQKLEVYAETGDGWLGIRPPESSFCWIPADTVELDDKDSGTVIEDKTVAWIGTQLGRARKYRWQVQLAKGEPVTVIGRSEREGPDGPQLWFRIVPPSGEFRWVREDQVVHSSEELIAHKRQRSANQRAPADAEQDRSDGSPDTTRRPSHTVNSLGSEPMDPPDRKRSSRRSSRSRESEMADATDPSLFDRDSVIGNGLSDDWNANPDPRQASAGASAGSEPIEVPTVASPTENQPRKRRGLIATVEFMTRPKLTSIGETAAPNVDQVASDDNWVAGAGRAFAPPPSLQPQASRNAAGDLASAAQLSTANVSVGPIGTTASDIMQVSGSQTLSTNGLSTNGLSTNGLSPTFGSTLTPTSAPPLKPLHVVPAERVARVRAECVSADVEQLSLILSRLMAAQATSAEVTPVAIAARSLAADSANPEQADRARSLADRADQYGHVANRRDGDVVIRNTNALMIPGRPVDFIPSGVPHGTDADSEPAAFQAGPLHDSTNVAQTAAVKATDTVHAGFLVQVYSARPHSPPFALTDPTGRTIAYVTPMPGVNLRPHLNSKITISGTQGFLTGLNTPHLMASRAVRSME